LNDNIERFKTILLRTIFLTWVKERMNMDGVGLSLPNGPYPHATYVARWQRIEEKEANLAKKKS